MRDASMLAGPEKYRNAEAMKQINQFRLWIEVMALVRQFHIYVQCSEREGCSLANIEVGFQGVPLVLSRTGPNEQTVEQGVRGDGDQEVLNQILKVRPMSNGHYTLIRLDSDKYCAIVDKNGTPRPGALVDQWVMARKMKWPKDRGRNWPPPEEARQQLSCESTVRNIIQ
jgi:hypothetical protein